MISWLASRLPFYITCILFTAIWLHHVGSEKFSQRSLEWNSSFFCIPLSLRLSYCYYNKGLFSLAYWSLNCGLDYRQLPACIIMLCSIISYRLSTTCWLLEYGPRLLKMRSSITAYAINVWLTIDSPIIILPVMVGSYPKSDLLAPLMQSLLDLLLVFQLLVHWVSFAVAQDLNYKCSAQIMIITNLILVNLGGSGKKDKSQFAIVQSYHNTFYPCNLSLFMTFLSLWLISHLSGFTPPFPQKNFLLITFHLVPCK